MVCCWLLPFLETTRMSLVCVISSFLAEMTMILKMGFVFSVCCKRVDRAHIGPRTYFSLSRGHWPVPGTVSTYSANQATSANDVSFQEI